MTLASGTRLGPYEITAAIGAGGMGEVYRGRDASLNRDVAMKVLPAAMAADSERLARFKREAQVLASLNHSNIAHVYGFESATLPDGSTAHFLAMELVEGEDLAERLKRGAIPIEESIAIAKQIAEGLEEAHGHGIIHRDLKPANIKVTPDGRVKILDFGLAKALEGDPSNSAGNSQLSHSPTMSRHMTEAGMIMGTAAYMSPEQARGKPVDKRADIWAFGVVFFEMLTGVRLFAGETTSDTLAAVLKTEVDFETLPAETSPAIRGLLRTCLERNPKNRLHDIADARIAIDEAGGMDPTNERSANEAKGSPPWRNAALAAAALLLVLATVFAWLAGSGPSGSAPSFVLRRLTQLPGLEGNPSLSPDGRQFVYTSAATGNLDIYSMRVGGDRAIDLTAGSSADDSQPALSPNGERIVFRSERNGGGLFVMGATGESVRRLTDDGFDPAWSPDGKRVAYSTEGVLDPYSRETTASLWIVDVESGEKRRLLEGDAAQPSWSPDGRRIAYWANSGGQRDLWTVSVDGGNPVGVTNDAATDWSPTWSPDGQWLYFSSDRDGGMNLFRMGMDASTGRARGTPETVTTSVGDLGWARFAADGKRLVAVAYERSAVIDFYRLDPRTLGVTGPLRTLRPRTLHWCSLSPDAAWLACSTLGSPEDLVLLRSDGSELRRLTDDIHKDRNEAWSPDGRRLAFQSTRSGTWSVWSVRVDGSEPRRLSDFDTSLPAWTPDGERVTVSLPDRNGLVELDPARMSPLSSARRLPFPKGLTAFDLGAWSPSGKLLGGIELDEARRSLSVGAFDPASGTYRRSTLPMSGYPGFGRFAGWLADARHFVVQGAEEIAVVDAMSGDWRRLLRTPRITSVPLGSLSLTRDGALMVETSVTDGDIWLMELKQKKEPGGER